jgi:hypothetical protein
MYLLVYSSLGVIALHCFRNSKYLVSLACNFCCRVSVFIIDYSVIVGKIIQSHDADPGSLVEKIMIRDKHPGFATLVMKTKDFVVSSCSDMKSLLKNKSFVLSTIAFTCVTYCAGAMMWWGPNFAFAGAPAFNFSRLNMCGNFYFIKNGMLRTLCLSTPVLLKVVGNKK